MSANHDTRVLSFVDILHAKRLAENGTVLNTAIRCTAAAGGVDTGLIKSMLPHTSRYTLMARYDGQHVVGQFYITHDTPVARLVYLAPQMRPNTDDSAWLVLLDAIVKEAGKRGAHVLTGEVDEDSELFTTMRQSGFAVYARQTLWLYQGDASADLPPRVDIREARTNDTNRIYGLYRRTVPRLMQQVETLPEISGFVYCVNDNVMGFVHTATGRDGVLLTPYIDVDAPVGATQVLTETARHVSNIQAQPIMVRVTRHQNWLSGSLADDGFECVAHQAVMVRHIAAGIHTPEFERLEKKLAANPAKRQTGELPEVGMN